MQDMDAVYRQHAQTVYKFLLSQCHDPHLAEELTQETFYQAVRSIDRFDGGCKVSVWLCQIAKHLWYQHLRKANRETELPEESELPLVPSAEEETMDRSGQLDLLRRVHQLPEPGREVVYLRAFGGLSFREINEGYTPEQARDEAARCMHCGHCKGCGTCVDDCPGYVLELKHLEERDRPEVAFGDECWHCANCRTSCPCGAIGFSFPLRMQV